MVTNPCSESALYRDPASIQYNFCHDCKNTPLFLGKKRDRHAIPGLHPRRSQCSCGARRDKFLPKVHGRCPDAAPGNAYEIIPPAVRWHSKSQNDNTVNTREFIVTHNFRPSIETHSSANFILTGPACPIAHLHMIIHGFACWKFAKPADEHHLQVLPARASLVLSQLPGFKELCHLMTKTKLLPGLDN